MSWTPSKIAGAVLLTVITAAAIAFLPTPPAWALLGQIAGSAMKMLGG